MKVGIPVKGAMCHSTHRHRTSIEPRSERGRRPDLRASDADRERVVDDLRDHAADGRISTDELEDRIAAALDARTFGELDGLVADLPRRPGRRPSAAARRGFREHLRTYVMVMALLVAIWALTGMGYFWPIWPMLGWGIGVASHASAVRRPRRSRAFS